jgi:DNA-binding NtrC family response regulator/tetratricopeptide (TPR) repeat protein
MRYAQTIAMAVDLLADGRAEDVARMLEPLLQPVDGSVAVDEGIVRLQSLAACIDVVQAGRPERALERLEPFESVDGRDRCGPTARADVALWLGWAHAFRDTTSDEEARALSLLDEALSLYARHHNVRGRCWARLGQARAYFALDEYNLMRRALDEAASLLEKVDDQLAARWLHDLRVPALRFEGRYEEARRHLDALSDIAEERDDHRIRGHVAAQRAALSYDLGASPASIVEQAQSAERLLSPPSAISNYPLLAAFHAHVGVLLRVQQLERAEDVIDRAADAVEGYPVGRAHLQTLRARVALRRGQTGVAEGHLQDLFEQAHHLPHGLHRSHVALFRAELLTRNGALDDADRWTLRALRNARETGHRGHQLRCLCTRASLLVRRGAAEEARTVMESTSAYGDYDTVLPYVVLRASAEGDVARALGHCGDARVAYSVARSAASVIQDESAVRDLTDRLAATDETAEADPSRRDERVTELPVPCGPTTASGKPSADAFEDVIGALLSHASRSVPLVAETWIHTVKPLFPSRWIGLYRRTAAGTLERLHASGTDLDNLPDPAALRVGRPNGGGSAAEPDAVPRTDTIRWIRLSGASRTPYFFGVDVPSTSSDESDGGTDTLDRIRPWLSVLGLALEHAEQHQLTTRRSALQDPSEIPVDGFVTESPSMQAVAQQLRRIGTSHSPVLITGERGAGMLHVAEAVHATSGRAGAPCTVVQCSSMQREPIDRKLFGDARDGTFTRGAFQSTDGGTVILHEVDALPESVQDRLIEAIESGDVVPVGASDPTPVDVRIVATSAADLRSAIRDGRFREDLYLHLNVIPIRVPPLRDRREDIPLLVRHYIDALRPDGTPPVSITSRAVNAMLQYDWPGNVRQLRNEIERTLLLVHSEPAPLIDEELLSDPIQDASDASPLSRPSTRSARDNEDAPALESVLQPETSLSDVLAATEAAVIKRVLAACDGQITASADVLGLTRQGLYKKMKRLNIDATVFQPSTASA